MKEIVMMEDSRIISDAAYNAKSLLRNERKRLWGKHTRGPFRGVVEEEGISFKDRLELALEVVKKLGVP